MVTGIKNSVFDMFWIFSLFSTGLLVVVQVVFFFFGGSLARRDVYTLCDNLVYIPWTWLLPVRRLAKNNGLGTYLIHLMHRWKETHVLSSSSVRIIRTNYDLRSRMSSRIGIKMMLDNEWRPIACQNQLHFIRFLYPAKMSPKLHSRKFLIIERNYNFEMD